MANLLHIVMDPLAVLMEGHKVLKDNGRIVIVDFTRYGMSLVKYMAMRIRFVRRYGRPCSYGRNLRLEELVGMARGANFVVEESKLLGEDAKAICLRGKRREIRSNNKSLFQKLTGRFIWLDSKYTHPLIINLG